MDEIAPTPRLPVSPPARPFAGPPPSAGLDIDVMRSVVAIAEAGSVTVAAARVGRTPAAVSMQLKKLEETLGTALFRRQRTGMAPTEACERLLPHARRLIETERAALEAFRGPALAGTVSVGVIDDFGGVRLSEVLAGFARCHPDVSVNVVMGASATLGPALAKQEVDLAVLTPGCAVQWMPNDRVLHEEPLVWAVKDGGDAFRRRPLPLAISASGCAWRRATLEALEREGIAYRMAYLSEFYEAQKAAVAADLAVAPLPRSRLDPGMRPVRISEGLPELPPARMALRLGPDPSDAARTLAGRIVASFGTG